MEIEVKYRNGVNKEGIVSVDFNCSNFNVNSLYKTFVDEYFLKIKKEDIMIILSDGYPINNYRLEKLKKELDGFLDRIVEVDVFITTEWENKVELGKKRKLSGTKIEPKKKKRKVLINVNKEILQGL